MNNVAIMADETQSTTMMTTTTTTTTTQSCVNVKKRHTNNDDYHKTNKDSSKHDDFFEDWKVGNWCWERDYNKYPVSSPNCHDDDCRNVKSNSNNEEMRTIDKACDDDGMDNDNEKKSAANVCSSSSVSSDKISSNKEIIAAEHKVCGEDGQGVGGVGGGGDDGHDKNGIDDDDDDEDEKKPAAIVSSSCSSDCVATTAAIEIAATTDRNVREEISKSSSRCPQIKAEKNDNDDENINNINDRSNSNEDDDSFYDDWVEGNWCLLDNYDDDNNNNKHGEGEGEGKGDDNNSTNEVRHEMTTRLRKKTRNENNTDDASTKRKSRRSRFHRDNDDDYDEDSCNEEEEEEEEESYNEEEEYEENNDDREEEEEDSNDVQNHQEDYRPARKRSRKVQIQDDQIWMGMFEKLVEYKKQHKNTIVPQRYYEHSQIVGCTKVGSWVNNQRTSYKNNKLLPNRIDLLNSIGFEWDGVKSATDQIKWMNMFEKLVQYKKQHKDTKVSKCYDEHSQIVGCTKLGSWVATQRTGYRNNKLLPNRIDLLDSIGFVWEGAKSATYQNKWMNMFQKLEAYKEKHKDTQVSKRYKEDPKLGNWVSTQRIAYKSDELFPKRLALLNSIGFACKGVVGGKVNDEKWMNMFQKLSAYKKQHKNTVVPKEYNKDPKLGRWVSKQRHFYNYNELHPERLALLNSIDFN